MKIRSLIAALGFVLVLCAGWVQAADLVSLNTARANGISATHVVSNTSSIALRVRWIGTAGVGATVAVSSYNLVFTTNGSTADTLCDAGGTPGTINVSAAAADTWGEVAGIINSSKNWRCILVDVLPSWTSTGMLTTAAANAAGLAEAADGISFKVTNTGAHLLSACMGPEWLVNDAKKIPDGEIRNQRSYPRDNSLPTFTNELIYTKANSTFTSGTATLNVSACQSDDAGATELLLWSQAGAASTADNTIDLTSFWDYDSGRPMSVLAPKGWRIVVWYATTATNATTSAGALQVHGLSWNQ